MAEISSELFQRFLEMVQSCARDVSEIVQKVISGASGIFHMFLPGMFKKSFTYFQECVRDASGVSDTFQNLFNNISEIVHMCFQTVSQGLFRKVFRYIQRLVIRILFHFDIVAFILFPPIRIT